MLTSDPDADADAADARRADWEVQAWDPDPDVAGVYVDWLTVYEEE